MEAVVAVGVEIHGGVADVDRLKAAVGRHGADLAAVGEEVLVLPGAVSVVLVAVRHEAVGEDALIEVKMAGMCRFKMPCPSP